MIFSHHQMIFSFSLILGAFLGVSSSSIFGAWIGLELNLLSFIPIIAMKNNQLSSEASLKYFLIQALGSASILFSGLMLTLELHFCCSILSMALLLKMGAAPLHFWLPQVMEGLTWFQSIILMTIQKMAPMFLLTYPLSTSSPTHNIIFMSAMMSAIVGALGGLNQTLLRKIMAFSSINHMSWMLSSLLINETAWTFYFLTYCLTSSTTAILFNTQKAYHMSQLANLKTSSPELSLLAFLSLLSLGGLPPFIGFLPKWILINELVHSKLFILLLFLLASALFTLYFYLRIATSFITLLSPKLLWSQTPVSFQILLPMLILLNLVALLLMPSTLLF
uniref:NADH-ubiquinone oxidoreductase chain 2 n=1 Tax=Axianassa australis TaxID=576642 RepID=A0A4Y5QJR2_9EUCA|nr:NADH dehydrogenase subunit 2 [Axianassa australis]QCX31752.1 NADH dehydrogenase subunit 2 [Axianassa australis]